MSNGKVALIILDGYGIGEPNDGNAIYMAQTPVMDSLLPRWPHTKRRTARPCTSLACCPTVVCTVTSGTFFPW